jgi:two-component system chemotaxis response regulator CheB
MAASARVHGDANPAPNAMSPKASLSSARFGLIAIGISTGGPQALKYLIPRLPRDFPVPIAIVLHMPVGYTELFARGLNDVSELDVREAHEGLKVAAGQVLLAPAGSHLSFVRGDDGDVVAHLSMEPLDTLHRPSVDVLFRSAAEVFGERVLAIVMTGMGADGTQGAAWVKAHGGRVLTEAEESCVVYGMPRSVVEAGLCDKCVPLARMADAIFEAL